jgi:ABC-type nickel/cobalt efflux system permease component RcnA
MQCIGFGLLLIVAFSVGLAAVFMALGLLMVYARQGMARFQAEGYFSGAGYLSPQRLSSWCSVWR